MELLIERNILYEALAYASRALSNQPNKPGAAGIRLKANGTAVVLSVGSRDQMVERLLKASEDTAELLRIIHEGEVAIPLRKFLELVKRLSGNIRIRVSEEGSISLKSSNTQARLIGFRETDQPHTPNMEGARHAEMACNKLQDVIRRTVFAASLKQTQPALTGVQLSFKANQLECAATNSHRLALAWDTAIVWEPVSCIVPSSSLAELCRQLPKGKESVRISITDKHVLFQTADLSFYSGLLDGRFPDVGSFLPQEAETVVLTDRLDLIRGLERACLFSDGQGRPAVVIGGSGSVRGIHLLSASSVEGRIEEYHPDAEISGCLSFQYPFAGDFLLDALSAIDSQRVRLCFHGESKPVLLEPEGSADQLHLVSAVRVPSLQ